MFPSALYPLAACISAALLAVAASSCASSSHNGKPFEVADILEPNGMVTIRTRLAGSDAGTIVYYGVVRPDPSLAPDVAVRQLDDPQRTAPRSEIHDYAFVVDEGRGHATLFPASFFDYVRYVEGAEAARFAFSACWPAGAKNALFVGTEDANGFLYHEGQWRWSQCGD